jgi:hypothetical protein
MRREAIWREHRGLPDVENPVRKVKKTRFNEAIKLETVVVIEKPKTTA